MQQLNKEGGILIMLLIRRFSVLVLFVIVTNTTYSQKVKWDFLLSRLENFMVVNFSKNLLSDTTLYIHVDSNIINGFVGIDSVKVDIFSKNVNDNHTFVTMGEGMIPRNDVSLFYKIHYPIPLIDNPLFKQAVYRDDVCGLILALHFPQKESEEKGYYILSSNNKYVNYAFLEKKDGNLYTKYDPLNEDDITTIMTIKSKNFHSWITQELEKNENKIVSITKNGKVYIVKLFNN